MGTPLASEPEPTPRELPASQVIGKAAPRVVPDRGSTPARGTPAPKKASSFIRANVPLPPPVNEEEESPPPPPAPIEKRMTPSRGSAPAPAATHFPGRHDGGTPETVPVGDPLPEPTPIRRPPALRSSGGAHPKPTEPTPGELARLRAIPVAELSSDAESEEIADEDVEEIADDEVMADPAADTGEEDGEEVMDADDIDAHAIESDETPMPSRLDPWLAQLIHGYCPPDAPAFNRHTPPTNFPGRD